MCYGDHRDHATGQEASCKCTGAVRDDLQPSLHVCFPSFHLSTPTSLSKDLKPWKDNILTELRPQLAYLTWGRQMENLISVRDRFPKGQLVKWMLPTSVNQYPWQGRKGVGQKRKGFQESYTLFGNKFQVWIHLLLLKSE